MSHWITIFERYAHLEHERRWRLHAEGELRNRSLAPEPEYRIPERTLDAAVELDSFTQCLCGNLPAHAIGIHHGMAQEYHWE